MRARSASSRTRSTVGASSLGERVHPLADLERGPRRAVGRRRGALRSTSTATTRRDDECRDRGDECEGGGAHRRASSLLAAASAASSSVTSWSLPLCLAMRLARSRRGCRSDSGVSSARELGEPARHRHRRLDAGERRRRDLEDEPARRGSFASLAGRLGEDQEELVGAARVPEGGVAAADRRADPLARTPARTSLPVVERAACSLLIAPKSSRSIWIRQSGRPWRRAALISRGSASSKALALPSPVRESVAASSCDLEVAEGVLHRRLRPPRDRGEDARRLGVERVRGAASRRRATPSPSGTTRPDRSASVADAPRRRSRSDTAVPSGGPSSRLRSALATSPRRRPSTVPSGRRTLTRLPSTAASASRGRERPLQDLVEVERRADRIEPSVASALGRGAAAAAICSSMPASRPSICSSASTTRASTGPPQGSPERDEHAGNTDGTESRNDYRSRDPLSFPCAELYAGVGLLYTGCGEVGCSRLAASGRRQLHSTSAGGGASCPAAVCL